MPELPFDVCRCSGDKCGCKKVCARFMAPGGERTAHADLSVYLVNGQCEYFIYHDKEYDSLSIWTICKHPKDFPNSHTARRHIVKLGECTATADLIVGKTLENVRSLLPKGLRCVPRAENDDPVIVESWL